MKKSIVLFCCLFVLNQLAFAQNESIPNNEGTLTFQSKASALLNECIQYKEMAGVAAGIYKEGEILWQEGAGFRDLKNTKIAESNMLHRTASIGKPMTAIAIMQLYEKGKLSLDDPVQKYLPYFPVKKEGSITIRHLLQHSSGIKAYQTNEEAASTRHYKSLKEAIAVFKDRDLNNKPGEGFQYTTYGYVVLGAVLESASGMSFRDYMKENIWNKAGMVHTDVEFFGKEYPNKSKLYAKNSNGDFVPDKNTDLSIKVPGGGFHSTVEDLLKFGQAVIENKLITKSSLELMIQNSGLKKEGNPYGMGWFLYRDETGPQGRLIGHSGSQSGTSTQLTIYLDKKVVLAGLANTAGAWPSVISLLDKLGDLTLEPEALKWPLKKVVSVDTEILDQYVGEYNLGQGRSIQVIRKGKRLLGGLKGGQRFEVFAESNHKFFIRSMKIDVEFVSDQNGIVTEMIFIENGEKNVLPKMAAKRSMANALYNHITEMGIAPALNWYKGLKDSPDYELNENEMNILGYELLQSGKVKEAIEVFKINVAGFPKSWNAYDSLGEAYAADENKLLAIENYEKSVSLNPENNYGKEALKRLKETATTGN